MNHRDRLTRLFSLKIIIDDSFDLFAFLPNSLAEAGNERSTAHPKNFRIDREVNQ
jgi:hypothetical protein